MRVLSLFDGMSCAQIALSRAGVNVDQYYASELDKFAIKITQKNFPNTVQLGDVREVAASAVGKIDLLVGGSPCQGFSFAGKQLNFDDPRSKLFFEYARVLEELKPEFFLLENVRMSPLSQNVISERLGVEPILINSSLVSAQNRQRLYWTNLPVKQPEDKNIFLRDILEGEWVSDRDKSYCIDANYYKGGNLKNYFEKSRRQLVFSKAGLCQVGVTGLGGKGWAKPVYHPEGKSPTLLSREGTPKIVIGNDQWRKLTPLECERLQTVPDNYTSGVSDTQRYKMLGNGMTVDVIAHILKELL